MRNSKSSIALRLSALAAAIALQGAALALAPVAAASTTGTETTKSVQTSAESTTKHAQSSMRHHRHQNHHRKSAMWIPGYGPLGQQAVESLSLNDTQQSLLKDARASQKELHKARREAMRSAHQIRSEQLKSGKLDPHSAMQAARDLSERAKTGRSELDAKWLAVWDSLNVDQQAKVAAVFNERAQKRAERKKKQES